MGGQRHAPASLLPRKSQYPVYRRLDGPQGRSGRVRKISKSPGFDPRTTSHSSIYFYYCACIHLGEDLWDVTCHFTWRRNIYSLIILGTSTKTRCNVCTSFYSTNTSLCICRITVTCKLKSRSRSHVTVHKTIRLRENYKTGIPVIFPKITQVHVSKYV